MRKVNGNKRKRTRFTVDVDGMYYFGNQWQPCRIFDLNLEGAALLLKQFFVKGDMLKLKFSISDDKEQKVINAEVCNVNGPRIGIKFLDVDDFDKEFLTKVINEKSKRYNIS